MINRNKVTQRKMGQNKKAVPPATGTNNVPPLVEDNKAAMIMDLAPGKKGCTAAFPWGGRIVVPPNIFAKKDSLITKLISPAERHLHSPPLSEAERLISELFIVGARNYQFKAAMTVELPFVAENASERDMRLRAKLTSDQKWTTIDDFTVDNKTSLVTFETKFTGLFVFTSSPRTERFPVTPQGCLYNARISRYISVRFPKKATDKTLNCEIRIQHVQADKVDLILNEFTAVCNDIMAVSHFYDITFPDLDGAVTFRRAVSVKIPNAMCAEAASVAEVGQQGGGGVVATTTDSDVDVIMKDEGVSSMPTDSDISVMQKFDDGWQRLDQTLRFTQTSVSFDVKSLGRFCLVKHKPGRAHRLKSAVTTLEERILLLKGEVIFSASLCEKSWRLLLDVVDKDIENVIAAERLQSSWKRLPREEVVAAVADGEPDRAPTRFRAPKPQPVKAGDCAGDALQNADLSLYNGVVFDLAVTGDIRLADGTAPDLLHVQYHEKLTDNYTYFDIVPSPNDKQNGPRSQYTGLVSVYHTKQTSDTALDKLSEPRLVRRFAVKYSQKQYDDYFYVEPEEVEPEIIVKEPTPIVVKEKPKVVTPKLKPAVTVISPAMNRLTTRKQEPVRVSREPKVLSGRSLKVLSAAVEHGLTLAVHLNLPDSAITGIGFDSMANGLSMQDVTYKVLMLWKRTFKGNKENQIEDLVNSIKDLGRTDIAAVLMDRHRRNIELTPDCFTY